MKFAVTKQKSYRIGAMIAFAAMAGTVLSLGSAQGRSMYEPIAVAAPPTMTPGQNLPINVTLEGPSNINIYSDPPGAVTYSGNLNGSSGTVAATTDPDVTGPVTVYLETDGAAVVTTDVTPSQSQGPGH